MANGTTVAASVYYSDTTTYTGNAGSKTNPYCIEDLYDLIENPYINEQPQSDLYYYIVVNDIDMNDYDEYKYSPPLNISLYFIKIDFKNHELRNITFYNISSAAMFKIKGDCNSSIHNLKLTNFISVNSRVTVFATQHTANFNFYFYNCDFSIYADTTSGYSVIEIIMTNAMSYPNYNVYCYNCIFNIKGNLSYGSTTGSIIDDSSIYMYYCHIHLYIIKNLYSIITTIGTFTSSYITGDIYGSTCYNNSLIYSVNSKLVNSYINVNFHNTKPENPTPIYGCRTTTTGLSFGSTFFINKSKLEGFTAPAVKIQNYYELTDEECKDLSKLQEIGFLTL